MCPVAASVVLVMTMIGPEARLEAQLMAFPPREVVEAQIEFVCSHCEYLHRMIEMPPLKKWCGVLLVYAHNSHVMWRELQFAQCKGHPLSQRIATLKRLRERLESDAFLRGRMPPIVCYWRFREGPPPLGCYPAPLHNKTGTGTVSNPELQ
jgi:hypothetical protein